MGSPLSSSKTNGLPSWITTFVGSVTAPLLWVFGTVLAWRESPAEHAARIASLGGAGALTCPTCGYNLTGLKGTRCPECGSEFTLDQLLASQPGFPAFGCLLEDIAGAATQLIRDHDRDRGVALPEAPRPEHPVEECPQAVNAE